MDQTLQEVVETTVAADPPTPSTPGPRLHVRLELLRRRRRIARPR